MLIDPSLFPGEGFFRLVVRKDQQPIIEIWQAHLDISPQLEAEYWAVLNAEEKQRAHRFVKSQDKIRFIAGRGILRSLLGQYLNLAPAAIAFDYLAQGKPILGKTHCDQALQFNVSHSHHLALYVISDSGQNVGIDLEFMRPLPEALSLARRFFQEQEVAHLVSLPPKMQEAMFFRLWTAKEAYLKATGEGLSGLQNIELTINQKSQQFDVMRSAEKVNLYSFIPMDDFVATVACLTPQSNQGLDTSNKWTIKDRNLWAENIETQLVFQNWDQ